MWKQLDSEGRLLDDLSWDTAGFYSKWHSFRNFIHEELWKYGDLALKKVYEMWGPTYLRYLDVQLRGYRKFRNSPDARLREVAEMHRKECEGLYPIFTSCEMFAPGERVREKVRNLRRAYLADIGKPSVSNRRCRLCLLG